MQGFIFHGFDLSFSPNLQWGRELLLQNQINEGALYCSVGHTRADSLVCGLTLCSFVQPIPLILFHSQQGSYDGVNVATQQGHL